MKRKFLQGLMAMGMVAAVTVGSSLIQAQAGTILDSKSSKGVTLNYAEQKLEITAPSHAKIYVAVNTAKTDKAGKTTITKEGDPVIYSIDYKDDLSIDLSSLPVTKDSYISVWGSGDTEKAIIKLPAINTKVAAVVDKQAATVTINDTSTKASPVAIEEEDLQYCTTNGVWKTVPEGSDFSSYALLGTSLRFRQKASGSEMITDGIKQTEAITNNVDKTNTTVYVPKGHFAGNEVKAKIAKAAAGPKATINYKDKTIKLPAKAEWRFVQPGELEASALTFTYVGDKASTLDLAKIAKDAKGNLVDGTLDIRTKAVVAEGKKAGKAASLIREYKLVDVNSALTASETEDGLKAVTDGEDVLVSYKTSAPDKNGKVTVTFTNNDLSAYQVTIDGVKKPVTVKAAKVKGDTKTATETKATKVVLDSAMTISRVGDAKTAKWSTEAVDFGTVIHVAEEETK